MKNNILSARQYGIIAFLLAFVFKFSLLPGLISASAGRDLWLVVVIAVLIEAGLLSVTVRISALGGIDAVRERYGTVAYLILTVPLIGVFVLKCAVYMSEVNTFTTSYLFYNVSADSVAVVLAVAVMFLAVRAAKGIGRVAEIALWLVPIVVLIGAVFGKIKLQPSYVLPIAADGFSPIAGAFDKNLFWFFDYTPLMFFRLKTAEDEEERKTPGKVSFFKRYGPVVGGGLSAVLMIPALYIVFVMTYGNSGHLVGNAFSSLGSFNVVNTEIGSIDWPAIVLWLCFAVIVLAATVFGAGRAIESVKVPLPIGVIAFTALSLILTETVFYNSERAVGFASGAVRYALTAVAVAATAVTLILLEVRRPQGASVSVREVSDEKIV